MPMKVVWALLDVTTIVLLVSGLVLWARRRIAEVEADDPLRVGVAS